jgi:hypothetical protein
MQTPSYTIDECDAAIREIDQELVRLRPLASSFSVRAVGVGSPTPRKADQLSGERNEWIARRRAILEPERLPAAVRHRADVMDAEAYAAVTVRHTLAILPDKPNAMRVRRAGGTPNVVGEVVGAVETRQPLCLDLRFTTHAERSSAGELEAGDVSLVLIEDALRAGDVVEMDDTGERYRVANVRPLAMKGVVHCYDARANRLDVAHRGGT